VCVWELRYDPVFADQGVTLEDHMLDVRNKARQPRGDWPLYSDLPERTFKVNDMIYVFYDKSPDLFRYVVGRQEFFSEYYLPVGCFGREPEITQYAISTKRKWPTVLRVYVTCKDVQDECEEAVDAVLAAIRKTGQPGPSESGPGGG